MSVAPGVGGCVPDCCPATGCAVPPAAGPPSPGAPDGVGGAPRAKAPWATAFACLAANRPFSSLLRSRALRPSSATLGAGASVAVVAPSSPGLATELVAGATSTDALSVTGASLLSASSNAPESASRNSLICVSPGCRAPAQLTRVALGLVECRSGRTHARTAPWPTRP